MQQLSTFSKNNFTNVGYEEIAFNKKIKDFLEKSCLTSSDDSKKWHLVDTLQDGATDISRYEYGEYIHELMVANEKLSNTANGDYFIVPQFLLYQEPYSDEDLNQAGALVDDFSAKQSELRAKNNPKAKLYAVSLVKYSLPYRTQTSRTELLQVLRQKQDRQPYVFLVTAEANPMHLASFILRAQEIDCVYHVDLSGLMEKAKKKEDNTAADLLQGLIRNKRLKGISGLLLDLYEKQNNW